MAAQLTAAVGERPMFGEAVAAQGKLSDTSDDPDAPTEGSPDNISGAAKPSNVRAIGQA